VGYNLDLATTQLLADEEGVIPARDLAEAVSLLEAPRIVWTMIPAGDPTEAVLDQLLEMLAPEDIVIDGGNANFNDSIRRATEFWQKKIHFLDVGVSGGVWGLSEGYSLMIGGTDAAAERARPIFEALAPGKDLGWAHVGPPGAGHFTKMVHNGIEYGMMAALAEGFDLLKARQDFALDLHEVAQVWQYGSVVRSWLLDLVERALSEDPELSTIAPYVSDSGEGRWTVEEAIRTATPTPVIAMALFQRFASRQDASFSAKLLSAMRNQFGGHPMLHQDRPGELS
jgi:6-phosphogluconate dehydrogenase